MWTSTRHRIIESWNYLGWKGPPRSSSQMWHRSITIQKQTSTLVDLLVDLPSSVPDKNKRWNLLLIQSLYSKYRSFTVKISVTEGFFSQILYKTNVIQQYSSPSFVSVHIYVINYISRALGTILWNTFSFFFFFFQLIFPLLTTSQCKVQTTEETRPWRFFFLLVYSHLFS